VIAGLRIVIPFFIYYLVHHAAISLQYGNFRKKNGKRRIPWYL
jgi:hypothetical protein